MDRWSAAARLEGDRSIHLSYVPETSTLSRPGRVQACRRQYRWGCTRRRKGSCKTARSMRSFRTGRRGLLRLGLRHFDHLAVLQFEIDAAVFSQIRKGLRDAGGDPEGGRSKAPRQLLVAHAERDSSGILVVFPGHRSASGMRPSGSNGWTWCRPRRRRSLRIGMLRGAFHPRVQAPPHAPDFIADTVSPPANSGGPAGHTPVLRDRLRSGAAAERDYQCKRNPDPWRRLAHSDPSK